MKKANIWISACVYLLFSAIFAACSSGIGNPITDDVAFVVTHLKHNIPKDYKIPIHYIPNEEGGHCWVELNVYHLEESLKALAQMFGNISTNRENITIIVQMLQGVRFRIGNSDLEVLMAEFECHYREEKWHTGHYFQYLEEFLIAARYRTGKEDCEPRPCPTATTTTTTTTTTSPSITQSSTRGLTPLSSSAVAEDCTGTGCIALPGPKHQLQVEQMSLASLLLIPLAAILFLLVWKVRAWRKAISQRSRETIHINGDGVSLNMPTLNIEAPEEKMRLNTMEKV